MDSTKKAVVRLPLAGAIASILGKKGHVYYRDIGIKMKINDLRKLLGLTGTPMLYNYMGGKTNSIEPERAKVILDKFGILIDDWLTPDELDRELMSEERAREIAYEPIREMIEEIVVLEGIDNLDDMKRRLRKIIARYY